MKSSSYSTVMVIASLVLLIMEPNDPVRFIAAQLFVCTTLICVAIERAAQKAGGGK